MKNQAIPTRAVVWKQSSKELLMNRYAQDTEAVPAHVLDRIAKGLAANEVNPEEWVHQFRDALEYCVMEDRIAESVGVLPKSPTLVSGFAHSFAKTKDPQSCDMIAAYSTAAEMAKVGMLGAASAYDLSAVAPKGSTIEAFKCIAPGCVPLVKVFQSVQGAGQRATIRCDHPDILELVAYAATSAGNVGNFGLTILVTDKLLKCAVDARRISLTHSSKPSAIQIASGAHPTLDGAWCYRLIDARFLLNEILGSMNATSSVNIVFIDRVVDQNNLHYAEALQCVDAISGQLLPVNGSCVHGHIVLDRFVDADRLTGVAEFNLDRLKQVAAHMVRMLDNVIELTSWPTPQQESEAMQKRRLAIGVTGLADAIALMGMDYGSARAQAFAANLVLAIRDSAYNASVELALERGPFQVFDRRAYLQMVGLESEGTSASRLPDEIRQSIRTYGIRNSHLIGQAPALKASRTFGNDCSVGFAPLSCQVVQQDPLEADDDPSGQASAVRAPVRPSAHLEMISAVSCAFDGCISESIEVAAHASADQLRELCFEAWAGGGTSLTLTVIKTQHHEHAYASQGPLLMDGRLD